MSPESLEHSLSLTGCGTLNKAFPCSSLSFAFSFLSKDTMPIDKMTGACAFLYRLIGFGFDIESC